MRRQFPESSSSVFGASIGWQVPIPLLSGIRLGSSGKISPLRNFFRSRIAFSAAAHVAEQPGASQCPMAVDRGPGQLQGLGSLFYGESGEEAQFHHLALFWVKPRKIVKRVVQCYQV